MKNNKGLMRHLPEDLWHDILSRLPVKSLLRFSCVSKSCLSMIKDPDFCSLHLKKFKNNRDETRLLFVQGSEHNCVLRCSNTFELTNTEALHTLGRHSDDGSWEIEFAIDGLVLLKRRGRNDLMLWNPSIRKFHDIPSLPEIGASDAEIGLGYDRLVNDYKHVKLIFANRDTLQSVAVYTLRAGSWKTIPFQCKGRSKWHWIREDNMMAVYLRGSLYFIAKDIKRFVMDLVSIDLSSEVFSCTSLPDVGGGSVSGPLTLVDDGSTLAVFDFWRDTAMWVLGSETTGWTPRYSFGFKVSGSLYHKKNGGVVIWEEGEKTSITLANVKESVSSDNLEITERMEISLQMKFLGFGIDKVCGYVESLILL